MKCLIIWACVVALGCVPSLEGSYRCTTESDCAWGWRCDTTRHQCVETLGDPAASAGDHQMQNDHTSGDLRAAPCAPGCGPLQICHVDSGDCLGQTLTSACEPIDIAGRVGTFVGNTAAFSDAFTPTCGTFDGSDLRLSWVLPEQDVRYVFEVVSRDFVPLLYLRGSGELTNLCGDIDINCHVATQQRTGEWSAVGFVSGDIDIRITIVVDGGNGAVEVRVCRGGVCP